MENRELLTMLGQLFDEKLEPIKQDLKRMDSKIESMDIKIQALEQGQQRVEKKLDAVYAQTADLTEFRTETRDKLIQIGTAVDSIRMDLNAVEIVTSKNWNEIAKLKAVK